MCFICFNDKRAREARPRGHFAREVPPDERLPVRRGAILAPLPPQGYHPSVFLRPSGPSKIDPFSGPLKIDHGGGKVAPWPPIGRQGLHLAYFRGPFWNPFSSYF